MTRLSLPPVLSAVRRSLLAASLVFATTIVVCSTHAVAQASSRALDGVVTLKSGGPAKGAVVHLKDTRSLSQRSYITAGDGTYHFAQLSGSTDYEVWADLDGKKTTVKSISSFDTKNSFNIGLKFND